MYWALVMLVLTIIKYSGDWLILVFSTTSLVISLLMLVVYPLFVSPIFNSYNELEEGELRTKIFDLCKQVNYNCKAIYL